MLSSTIRLAGWFCFTYRSLFGCGFLLLLPSLPLWAQRGLEISLSGGVSLSKPTIMRYHLPSAFQAKSYFNTGAVLRLTIPLSARFGLGLEQRVTGLSQGIRYRYQYGGGRSTSIDPSTIHQSGVSLRLYDVARLGPRWTLDALLTGAYSWTSSYYAGVSDYQLLGYEQPSPPSIDNPQIRAQNRYLRRGIYTAGVEVQLAYEFGSHHALLLMAGYQRGLQPILELRSTRAEYLDEAGALQQGRFTISNRCSYGTAQLGYAFRLSSTAPGNHRNSTPRYSIEDDANKDETSTEPPIE